MSVKRGVLDPRSLDLWPEAMANKKQSSCSTSWLRKTCKIVPANISAAVKPVNPIKFQLKLFLESKNYNTWWRLALAKSSLKATPILSQSQSLQIKLCCFRKSLKKGCSGIAHLESNAVTIKACRSNSNTLNSKACVHFTKVSVHKAQVG